MSKLGYQTLRENVVAEIRKRILKHELKPGMRIVEQSLSEELEVSRGPIREALRQLEQEGLVEYTRNVGCSVKEVTIRDIHEIYLLRSVYEMLAVRISGGKYREEDFQRMEAILDEMKNLCTYEEAVICDHKLHQILVERAGSERIIKVWSDLDFGNVVGCYIAGFDEQELVQRQYRTHKELADACRTEDVDVICGAIREHYMNSVRHFVNKEGLLEQDFYGLS